MIISNITLSYPYVQYEVKISHFTARKSTAIEWVILEAINKCESSNEYGKKAIGTLFEEVFTISDANQLIKPCLISLQDIGAINVKIDDDTDLNSYPMKNLKLTKLGKEMQINGLLPGAMSEEFVTVYYDVTTNLLRDAEYVLYRTSPTGIKVKEIKDAQDIEFPASVIRKWLLDMKENRTRGMSWLTSNTRIDDITPNKGTLLWKNVSKKVELKAGLVWKVVGEENQSINEISLYETSLKYTEEQLDLPKITINDPDEEIKNIVPIADVDSIIKDLTAKDTLFCINEKYFFETRKEQSGFQKKLQIGIVFGATELNISTRPNQIILKITDKMFSSCDMYVNSTDSVQVGVITVSAGSISRDIPIAYIPKNSHIDFISELIKVVDNYYENDYTFLFILCELGFRDLFLEYTSKLIEKEDIIANKVNIIDTINKKSIEVYNKKMILASEMAKLLVDKKYISQKAKSVKDAIAILDGYSGINAFKQDEGLFQEIIKILLESIGSQDSLDDIWELWKSIKQIKKSYLDWINKTNMYKCVYSKKSILSLFERFFDDQSLIIDVYTAVEQIIVSMKKTYLQIHEKLPEINLLSTASSEKFNEVILAHRDLLNDLYEDIRQWKEEEEKINIEFINSDEILSDVPLYANVTKNIDKLRNSLATFFDDSFIKYSKVFIIDTCTLMNDPSIISWFDDGKALLVIPLVVLEELDRKKVSKDGNEAYNAREAIRNISEYSTHDWLRSGVTSFCELIPNDLDKSLDDNKILSIALKYSAKQPILLTDDINLGNVADSQNIKCMNLDSYKEMKEHQKINRSSKIKNKKK